MCKNGLPSEIPKHQEPATLLHALLLSSDCSAIHGYLENMKNTKKSKKVKFPEEKNIVVDMFLILVQNIDCGYMLEPPRRPRRGESNKYQQPMFWIKIRTSTM